MKLIVSACALLSALATTCAYADGMDKTSSAPAGVAVADATSDHSWTGLYVGASIGAGSVTHDLDAQIGGVGTVFDFNGIGGRGMIGTISAGYDRQLSSRLVAGVFADYDFSSISTDLSLPTFPFSASFKQDNSWTVGARLGYLTTPSTLWYGLAGYTDRRQIQTRHVRARLLLQLV